jgi:hypothetical protein
MEPEQRPRRFLHHDPRPVAPRHVQQLVAQDRALRLWVHSEETLGQQDDRVAQAEAGRLRDLVRETDLGARSRTGPDRLEVGREDCRPAALPKLAQPHGPGTEPDQSRQRPGAQQAPQDRGRRGQPVRNRDGIGARQDHRHGPHAGARSRRLEDRPHGEREAGERDAAPVGEAKSCIRDAAQRFGSGRRRDDREHLRAEDGQRIEGGGHHSASSMSRFNSSRSAFVSRPSFTRCARRGREAPSKTRSTKSRTSDVMTRRSGRAGR